jgi:hypothetical protein
MRRSSKDAFRAGVALLAAAVFASALVVGARAGSAEATSFSITEITANCDGSGVVSFTGTIPDGGFTLELMDKAPDNSGSFIPTSPPTVITITSGDSPIAYTMPLGNWSPPHYRVDSNFSTKSPSLSCEAGATDTPQPTATQTVSPTASASQTATATGSPTTSATVSTGSTAATNTSTAVVSGSSGSGAPPAASPAAAVVNTTLALVRPPNAARLPSALPNTGEAGASAAWARGVLPPALGMLALALLVAVSGCCYRSAFGRRDR